MFEDKFNYKLINVTVLLCLLYLLISNIGLWIGILGKTFSVCSPFIIGFAFAYALTPIVRLLRKKGVKKDLANLIVIFGVVLIILFILLIILPLVYDQLKLFIQNISKSISNLGLKFNINLGSYEIKVEDYLNDLLKEIGAIASSSIKDIISTSLGFVSKFIVGFVGFIYFLTGMDKIRSFVGVVISNYKKRTFRYLKLLDAEITNYIKGLGTFMLIQLLEYSFLYLIIGHPNWLLLGVLACFTTVIPYFGGLITNLIALLTATVISGPLTIATIVICLIFPQLDGYYISPKVYGKTNNVNPLITIMAVSIGGTLLGPIGIIIALPCYLLIRTTFNFYKKDIKKGITKVKDAIDDD